MEYLDFFKKLNNEKIEYLIVGGLAMIIYGAPRFTYDIDIVIALENKNIFKLMTILGKLGYKVKIPVNPLDFADKEIREDWIKNKNMKAFNFYNDNSNIPELDIVIAEADYELLKKNQKHFFVDDVLLPLPSIDDLIAMKNNAGRKVDYEDVEFLKIIEKNNV